MVSVSCSLGSLGIVGAPDAEVWWETTKLRVKEQDNGKFLVEQHWRSNHGNGEWRKLPLVMKDGSDGG